MRITTAQTGTCLLTVGVGGSALSFDNLMIDSLSCNATGLFDNITDKGTGGKSRQIVPANSWVNCIVAASGSATSLVGTLYFDVTVA